MKIIRHLAVFLFCITLSFFSFSCEKDTSKDKITSLQGSLDWYQGCRTTMNANAITAAVAAGVYSLFNIVGPTVHSFWCQGLKHGIGTFKSCVKAEWKKVLFLSVLAASLELVNEFHYNKPYRTKRSELEQLKK